MNGAIEMPLSFAGHTARIVVSPAHDDGWHVRAEVDGRTLGWEHYTHWLQVERFRARMQEWINTAAGSERGVAA